MAQADLAQQQVLDRSQRAAGPSAGGSGPACFPQRERPDGYRPTERNGEQKRRRWRAERERERVAVRGSVCAASLWNSLDSADTCPFATKSSPCLALCVYSSLRPFLFVHSGLSVRILSGG